jgi:hypothetical protein
VAYEVQKLTFILTFAEGRNEVTHFEYYWAIYTTFAINTNDTRVTFVHFDKIIHTCMMRKLPELQLNPKR